MAHLIALVIPTDLATLGLNPWASKSQKKKIIKIPESYPFDPEWAKSETITIISPLTEYGNQNKIQQSQM